MWEREIAWNEDLPEDLAGKWHQWCSEILYLKNISINRHYDVEHNSDSDVNSKEEREIHVFTDVSEKAAAIVLQHTCVV